MSGMDRRHLQDQRQHGPLPCYGNQGEWCKPCELHPCAAHQLVAKVLSTMVMRSVLSSIGPCAKATCQRARSMASAPNEQNRSRHASTHKAVETVIAMTHHVRIMREPTGSHLEKLEKACDETLRWIEKNQTAERDEFEFRMKEVQRVCNPVVAKLYQANAGGGGKGPRIEEMD